MTSSRVRQRDAKARGSGALPPSPSPVAPKASSTNVKNVNVLNYTINVVEPLAHSQLQGLVNSLTSTLKETLNIDPVQSTLTATDGATTLQDALADELADKCADVEAQLREQGVSKFSSIVAGHSHQSMLTVNHQELVRCEFGLPNPPRSLKNVTIKVALVAIRKEGSNTFHSEFLSRSRHVIFEAEELASVRYLCTEALLASRLAGLHDLALEKPWTELKEHLMVYLPGHNWQCWMSPYEKEFAEWYDDVLTRGHVKDVHMRVGLDEEMAARLGALDNSLKAIGGLDPIDETVKVLTDGAEMQNGVERDY